MKTIWKYQLTTSGFVQTLSMPLDSEILSVQVQQNISDGIICIWALVDPETPMEDRKFILIGTGHDIPVENDLDYLGTVQLYGGNLVIHIFEVDPK